MQNEAMMMNQNNEAAAFAMHH